MAVTATQREFIGKHFPHPVELFSPTNKTSQIREVYGRALVELGHKNPKIVALDADVSRSTRSHYFAQTFPHRFFNVGIAELNLVGMTAGLAASGLIPFCNAFSNFLTLRGGDAIQNLIGLDRLPAVLAAAYGGYSGGLEGASHHAIGDIAQMRTIPGMTILTVCDEVSTQKAVEVAAQHGGPVYLRLYRARVENLYDHSLDYTVGGSYTLRYGDDVTVLAVGPMVQKALAAAESLEQQGISAGVIDCYSIKPLDQNAILTAAKHTGALVTAEEHSRVGGFGSAVSELTAARFPVPVEMVAIDDVFAESGTYEELNNKYGLTAEAIVTKAKRAVQRKR